MRGYRTAVVLGNGCSGKAAAELLRREGARVVVLSRETTPDFGVEQLPFVPEVAIVSPGFALNHPWMDALSGCGVPLLSELELGWSRRRSRVIAVTGSNGKSTVVKWLADALTQAGLRAVPCGNYGLPVSEAVLADDPPDWLVLEVSSFQLETVDQFAPDFGVLLNVLPNHLDRHGSMEAYRALKLRLFERMKGSGTAIVPADIRRGLGAPRRSVWKTFGTDAGAEVRFHSGRVGEVDLRGTYFDNEVLGVAAAAVVAVWRSMGLPRRALEASARCFEPLPHRMQRVAVRNGVTYVNDSKATNVAGLCAALRMLEGRVHLIAGGRVKEKDLSFAKDLLAQQVVRLYLIGEASSVMQSAWGDVAECLPCETLQQAVDAAAEHAELGDTVLLSPACTSFDQFGSFAERGDVFVGEVNRLIERGADA